MYSIDHNLSLLNELNTTVFHVLYLLFVDVIFTLHCIICLTPLSSGG